MDKLLNSKLGSVDFSWLGYFLLVIWGIFWYQMILGIDLNVLGVWPRELRGLTGILFEPLLHGNLDHLIGNTVPLALTGAAICFLHRENYKKIFLISYFVPAILTWVLARGGTVHIGASGVVYAFVWFLISEGFYSKKPLSMAISFLGILFFGSSIAGMMPGQYGISWEGHLFGFLTGHWTARYINKTTDSGEKNIPEDEHKLQ